MKTWISRVTAGAVLIFAAGRALCADVSQGMSHTPSQAAGDAKPEEEPVLSDNPTLDEYVDYALRHNPSAEAARLRAAAAAEKPAQEKSLDDPKLSYRYAIRSDQGRQSLAIEQMLPWPGSLSLRNKTSVAMALAESNRSRNTLLEVVYAVRQAYYQYYYLGRLTSVAADNLDLMKQFHAAALARYRTSEANYADVAKALVEIGKVENDLRMYQDMRPSAAAKLNAAINRPAGEERAFPQAVDQGAGMDDLQILLPQAFANNPRLTAMDAETEAARRQVELAKKAYRPNFLVGFEWKDMKDAMMRDEFMIMAGITIPIWRGKYRAAEVEARLRVKAAEAGRAGEANMISADLAMAAFRWRDADRRIGLYRDTLLPTAKEALKAAQAAYSVGEGRFLDLIDSQKTLLDFEIQYERALADRAISAAEIEMLTGSLAGTDAVGDAVRP